VTVLDTSAAVDYLLGVGVGVGVAKQVQALALGEGELGAPDLLVFEVLAVLRRETRRRAIAESRASGAVEDLGDLPIELFPCTPLRRRAWSLQGNLTAADALFVALAEHLQEPLATKDRALATEAPKQARLEVLHLEGASTHREQRATSTQARVHRPARATPGCALAVCSAFSWEGGGRTKHAAPHPPGRLPTRRKRRIFLYWSVRLWICRPALLHYRRISALVSFFLLCLLCFFDVLPL
jgi:predicted nucleic acid-binding protein